MGSSWVSVWCERTDLVMGSSWVYVLCERMDPCDGVWVIRGVWCVRTKLIMGHRSSGLSGVRGQTL